MNKSEEAIEHYKEMIDKIRDSIMPLEELLTPLLSQYKIIDSLQVTPWRVTLKCFVDDMKEVVPIIRHLVGLGYRRSSKPSDFAYGKTGQRIFYHGLIQIEVHNKGTTCRYEPCGEDTIYSVQYKLVCDPPLVEADYE